MANQMSDYLRQYIHEHVLMGADHPSPSGLYLALYTSDPTSAATGTEVTGGGYTRQSLGFQLGDDIDVAVSSALVTFANATTNWGRVTHWAVFDAASDGNLLYFGEAEIARDVASTNTIVVPAQNIVVDLSGDPV